MRYLIFALPVLAGLGALIYYAATYQPPLEPELTFEEAVKSCLLAAYEPTGVISEDRNGEVIVTWADGGQPTAYFVIHRRLKADKTWDQLGTQEANGVRNYGYTFTDRFAHPSGEYVYGISTVFCRKSSPVVEAKPLTP